MIETKDNLIALDWNHSERIIKWKLLFRAIKEDV